MAFKTTESPGFFNKRDMVIRHTVILLLSFFFSIVGKHDEHETFIQGLFSHFIQIALIWNGNLLIINITDQFFSLERQLKQKLTLSAFIAIIWPIVATFLFNTFLFPIINGKPCDLTSKENITYLVISIVITLFINTIFVALAFFRFWRTSIQEKEELKRENLTAEFEALKNQVNPHFLFNSLNTLSSLIEEHPKVASEFVLKLSAVYRYVLSQRDKEKVTLHEELSFINSYVYLNQIRFGKNLQVEIMVDVKYHEMFIPTMALQMLLENAIKHNIISAQYPLKIYIKVSDEKLIVENNLQRKNSVVDSNGIGLSNIVHRYSLLTSLPVEVEETASTFKVSLPLLT
jgi:sensor histidine kinase YesM